MGEQRCGKCGGEDISFRYHTRSYGDHSCAWGAHTKDDHEHLHYCCHTCGWDWVGPTSKMEPRDA